MAALRILYYSKFLVCFTTCVVQHRLPDTIECLTGGGTKDVPFFPYAPYQPQAEMKTSKVGFSRHQPEQLSTVEEDMQEEEEHEAEDSERVCTA